MKSRNWFWGLFFLLAAVFVIACQTGSFGQINALSLVATVLLAALGINSAVHRDFFGIFIPLALLYLIYQKPLGLMPISFWILVVAAVFAATGFSILFHGRWHGNGGRGPGNCCGPHGRWEEDSGTENLEGDAPHAKVSFGSSSKYLHADCLKKAQFSVSFGEMDVFFDQARPAPEGAEVLLDCNCGKLKLYIPRGWEVVDHVQASLGTVEIDSRMSPLDAPAPLLTLSGNVSLGNVEVRFI